VSEHPQALFAVPTKPVPTGDQSIRSATRGRTCHPLERDGACAGRGAGHRRQEL